MRAAVIALLLWGSANAAVLEISSSDQGRLDAPVFGTIGDPLFFYDDAGIGGTQVASDFPASSGGSHYQVFDLSAVEGTVESATYSIWLAPNGYEFSKSRPEITGCCDQDNYYLVNGFRFLDEILAVRDGEADLWTDYGVPVWDAVAALVAEPNELAIEGTYGGAVVRESDEGTWIDITLSAAAIADINAALGGRFGVSGQNSVVYCANPSDPLEGFCRDAMFDSPDSGFAKLTLTGSVSVVPIPAAVWLFGSALAGLVGLRRWRQ